MNGIPSMPCSPKASRALFFFGEVQGAFEQHEKGGVDFLVAHTGEKRFPGEAADALDGQRAVFLEELRVDARIAQEDVGKAVLDVLEVALFLAKAGVDAFLSSAASWTSHVSWKSVTASWSSLERRRQKSTKPSPSRAIIALAGIASCQ